MRIFYQLNNIMRPRLIQHWFLLNFCLLWFCLFSEVRFSFATVISEAVVKTTQQTVLQQAENLQLAQHETWLALLHYKRETVLQRFISQVDDEHFS